MQNSLTLSSSLPASGKARLFLKNPRVLLITCGAVFAMLVLNMFHRVEYTGDEAFYSVISVNMLHSPAYILRPSFFPEGDFQVEKGGINAPPFNSYLYAIALWASRGALASQELINVLAFALLLYFGYRLLRLYDPQAGGLAALLLAISPQILLCYSLLEQEPLMTTAGIMALYFVLKGGFATGQRRWLFAGALAMGFSFGFKLWLCGPLALAVAVALGFRAWQAQVKLRLKLLYLALFGLVAILPVAAYLLAVAYFYPQDLSFWLKDVYFGVFTGTGISATKFSGEGVYAQWSHPIWYYAPLIYRDHFFLVPIFLFGLGSVFSDKKIKRELLWVLLAGVAGLVPLSLVKIKEFLYILSCVVFLYLLAGVFFAALIRRLAAQGDIDPLSRRLGTAVTLGLLVLFPVAWKLHVQPEKITGPFVIAHTIAMTLLLGLFWWTRRRPAFPLEQIVYSACALFLVGVFGWHLFTRKEQDKLIARAVQPYVQQNSPQALSFIASNFRSYQFLTFRKGCYWTELPTKLEPEQVMAAPEFANVRAFIIDLKEEQGAQMASWYRWLEAHATEQTASLNAQLGKSAGIRVFVRQ